MANSLGRVCVTGATGKAGGRPSCTCASTATTWSRPTSRSAATTWRAGVLRGGPHRLRPGDRGAARHRRRRPPGEHPGPGHGHPRGDVQRQRLDELQHLPRRRRPRPDQGGVGVKRDDPGPAVRPRPGAGTRRARRTALRPGRRRPFPVPFDDLRPVEGRQRDDRGAGLPLVRHPVRRPAHLQHHGAPRLPALPRLLAGPALPQVERVGLRRRPRRRRRLPPRPGSGRHGQPATSSSPRPTRS